MSPTSPTAIARRGRRAAVVVGLLVALLEISLLPAAAQDGPSPAPDGPAMLPILASSELARGPNRLLFALTDRQGQPLAAPDVRVHLRFYDDAADPDAVAFETDARFLWAIEGVRGLYAAHVDFPHAGRWGTRFDASFPDGRTETVRADFDVADSTSTPAIGAPAPPVDSPTAEDVDGDLARISTDPDPLERFYRRSILDAIEAGAPAVIAFVTPGFCQSATCGPTLDKVKTVAAQHPELTVVHVEPYVMQFRDGYLQPLLSADGQLQAAPWTSIWGLRTEPFVVVIDAEGLVRTKLEGAITVEELEEALATVL
jgi:hypothetical protein